MSFACRMCLQWQEEELLQSDVEEGGGCSARELQLFDLPNGHTVILKRPYSLIIAVAFDNFAFITDPIPPCAAIVVVHAAGSPPRNSFRYII